MGANISEIWQENRIAGVFKAWNNEQFSRLGDFWQLCLNLLLDPMIRSHDNSNFKLHYMWFQKCFKTNLEIEGKFRNLLVLWPVSRFGWGMRYVVPWSLQGLWTNPVATSTSLTYVHPSEMLEPETPITGLLPDFKETKSTVCRIFSSFKYI